MRNYGYGHDLFLFIPGMYNNLSIPEEIGLLKIQYDGNTLTDYRGDICDIEGTNYSINTPKNTLGGVSFLQKNPNQQMQIPFHFMWMNENEKRDVQFIVMDPNYHNSFQMLLEMAMDQSTLKKLYIRTRCQGYTEQNNIIGTLSVKRFMEKVVRANLLVSNFTYILADSSDESLHDLINCTVAKA